ncbi:hypothetical protein E5D57_007608 [Metarhizium anisopliae]|nr:hypothetical protein E5D57_007608 [Metarhizium anisopliae]
MPESVLSILCSEPWRWDSFASSEITFNQDGTGKLTCRAGFNAWIAAEIEWTARHAESLQEQITMSQHDSCLVDRLEIELTLTKRRPGGADMSRHRINEDALKEGAFLPKTYTLCLEKGEFHAQSYVPEQGQSPRQTPKFQLRLAFDPSPYPPRQEWVRPHRGPDSMKFWEWTQFCSRHIGFF